MARLIVSSNRSGIVGRKGLELLISKLGSEAFEIR